VKSLERHTRAVRDSGSTALVPYFMAGLTPNWIDYLHAAVQAGATTIEVGVPFSDPLMDGVIIQEAGLRSLARGTTFASVCSELVHANIGVPLVAMTYYNLFHHDGDERALGRLQSAGITGAIVPDLTLEESAHFRAAADLVDVACISIVAPSTPVDRVAKLATATEGFCYASARMAVTGVASDEGNGARVVADIANVSDIPTYIGIGVTTPEQASLAAKASDGVIIGSAIVARILEGASPSDIEQFLGTFHTAMVSN